MKDGEEFRIKRERVVVVKALLLQVWSLILVALKVLASKDLRQ